MLFYSDCEHGYSKTVFSEPIENSGRLSIAFSKLWMLPFTLQHYITFFLSVACFPLLKKEIHGTNRCPVNVWYLPARQLSGGLCNSSDPHKEDFRKFGAWDVFLI